MGNININGKSGVYAKSKGILTTVDTCMTPPFCIPINYTNIAESKMTDMGASSVKIEGCPACNQKSNFKISKGDAPGCCGGTSSGSTQQMAEFIIGSQDVKICGEPAVRNDDKMVSNLKNTPPQPLVQPPAGDAKANTVEAPVAASEFSQSINFAGLIGRDVDTGQLLARLPYVSYDEKGEPIPEGSGTLSKEGITKPIFTHQAETIKVVLGGDSAWRKYADAIHEGDEQSGGSSDALNIRFFGLDGDVIKGLECKVCMGSTTKTCTTDEQGLLPVITPEPNATLELSVKKFDGSYKVIDKTSVASGNTTLEYVSPKIVVEVKTEKHKGEPGQAETQAPKPVANDRGDKEPAPKKTKTTPKHISGKTPPKKEEALKPGRDAKGNPQTTYTAKITDWWNSWRMPSINLWNPMNLVASITNKLTPSADAATLAKVDDIIEYLEGQADYDFGGDATVAVLSAMTKGTFGKTHKHGDKKIGTSMGQCYKYVKVALVRTQWVKDALVGESASTAGPQLLANGFTDVTDILPDSRWAAPGDISVYAWTAEHLDEMRKKKNKPNYPNHGHIDVRSYDNYLTDYIPKIFRPNWSHYESPRVYRLYHDPVPILRMKAFLSCLREYEGQEEKNEAKRYQLLNCALPGTNTKYFTSFETHPWANVPKDEHKGKSTAAGAYQILYTSWVELLTGKNGKGVFYAYRKMFSLSDDDKKFTPALQDRMAIALIELREALGYVRKGEIDKAIDKLKKEWSSLPGGTENEGRKTTDRRPMNLAYFEELFNVYLTEEKKKAGIK